MLPRISRNIIIGLAGIGVLIGLLAITGPMVVAQVRATLTKNVDEPWRTPLVTRSQFIPAQGCYGVSDCANFVSSGTVVATFDLPTVPAGKRWVVQSASGGFTSGATLTTLQIEFGSPRPTGIVFDGIRWIFAGPFATGTAFSSSTFSANLNVVFAPGETPFVRVSGQPNWPGYSVITFSGYLIDATN